MTIFRRLSDSMFSPKSVYNYKDDKWGNVVGMFLILVFLLVIPTSISVAMKNSITYEEKTEIKKIFADEHIPFQIRNGILLNENADDGYVYEKPIGTNFLLVITNDTDFSVENSAAFIILLGYDGVYLYTQISKYKILSYQDYDVLNDVDLSELGNIKSSNWDNIFIVINGEYKYFMRYFKPLFIIFNILYTAGSLIVMSLMISLLQYFILKDKITFSKFWKLCLYLFTPFAVLETIFALFNINLVYISLIITAVYIIRLSRYIQSQNVRGN